MSAEISIQPLPDAVRRTALVLHALAAADREWVLGRLPERNRAQVLPCLEELVALGIPRDTNFINVALPSKTPARADVTRRDNDTDRLVAALKHEAANLIAMALRPRTEAERAAVLESLAPGKAREVRELFDAASAIPSSLQSALEDAVSRHEVAQRKVASMPRGSLARRWQAGWLRITGGVFQ